jgi:hypothetical protein
MGIWRIKGEVINYIYAKIPKLHVIIRGAHWCKWVHNLLCVDARGMSYIFWKKNIDKGLNQVANSREVVRYNESPQDLATLPRSTQNNLLYMNNVSLKYFET